MPRGGVRSYIVKFGSYRAVGVPIKAKDVTYFCIRCKGLLRPAENSSNVRALHYPRYRCPRCNLTILPELVADVMRNTKAFTEAHYEELVGKYLEEDA